MNAKKLEKIQVIVNKTVKGNLERLILTERTNKAIYIESEFFGQLFHGFILRDLIKTCDRLNLGYYLGFNSAKQSIQLHIYER